MEEKNCIVCGSEALVQLNMDPVKYFYSCPVCGRYEYYVSFAELTDFDLNHLGAYLVYNGFKESISEYRYFSTMSKERCDEYKREFAKGNVIHGNPVRLEVENVENWYPKKFSEKVDHILLYLDSKILHWGEYIKLEKEELFSCFFVDRYDYVNGNYERRSESALKSQAKYMMRYLKKQELIETLDSVNGEECEKPISVTPKGYARIDVLQKNTANGKNVLVAMKFGEDTKIERGY